MDLRDDFDLKLPSGARIFWLLMAVSFVIHLLRPINNLSQVSNELRAISGTFCLFLFINWWLAKDGLSLHKLLSEGSQYSFKSRLIPAIKLLALYLIIILSGVFLIDRLCSSTSFQLWFTGGTTHKNQRILDSLAGAPVWGVINIAIISPVVEELFFRRFFYTALRKRFGFVCALAGTSITFGLIHAPSLFMIAVTMVLGGFLGYLFEKRRDITANIVFHSLNNIIALLIFSVL